MNKQIENQYSNEIALAPKARALNHLAGVFQSGFCSYILPKPLEDIGLRIGTDKTQHGLEVSAHGLILHGRFDHAWFDAEASRTLVGRIRFYRKKYDGTDRHEVAYECLFKSAGKMRLGEESEFAEQMSDGWSGVSPLYCKLAFALVRVIHAELDVVESR